MRTVLRAASIVALAMATHAGFGTAIIFFFNDAVTKYSEPERAVWIHLLFLEASIGFTLMLICYFTARRILR